MSDARSSTVPTLGPTNDGMVGVVLGNYRILGAIRTGGMGTVYRAQHELLGRPAALKLLRPELTANEELVTRFFNEARAATAIRHPGIIEVYDFGYTPDGVAYLVMELLEGKSLDQALEHVGRFTELEAAAIARDIASALKAAHAKGIIHRDLKPDNVFLVPDLDGPTGGTRAKVLDFGIAKLADTSGHTQTGALMGTPLYMAPEQARAAGTIDHRADLYSLGCILYELLVGEPPFVAEGIGEVIALQMFAQPEPPSARQVEITPEMEQLVLRLLAKEPHERYQSAAEVISALAAVGASGDRRSFGLALPASRQLRIAPPLTPVPSPRGTFVAADAPPPARRSAMPIIAGALTIVIAGVVAAFLVLSESKPSGPDHSPPVGGEPTLHKPAPSTVPPPVTPSKPSAEDLIVVEDPEQPPPIKRRPIVKKVKGPTTTEGSPIELGLDDTPPPKQDLKDHR